MHKLQLAMTEYAIDHGGVWPDRLDQIKDRLGGKAATAKLMKNPLTGDDPGYEYVKPPGKEDDPGFVFQVVLYQLRGGKRDMSLKVGYVDGSVRPYEAPPPAAKRRNLDWKTFAHPQGKFTVLMPGTPKEFVQHVNTNLGKVKNTFIAVELADEGKIFMIVFGDYPKEFPKLDAVATHKLIDGVVTGVARSMKGKVQKKSRIKLGDYHGQEVLLDHAGEKKKSLCRFYAVDNRLYQLFTGWPGTTDEKSPDAEKFLNSFKVVK